VACRALTRALVPATRNTATGYEEAGSGPEKVDAGTLSNRSLGQAETNTFGTRSGVGQPDKPRSISIRHRAALTVLARLRRAGLSDPSPCSLMLQAVGLRYQAHDPRRQSRSRHSGFAGCPRHVLSSRIRLLLLLQIEATSPA
jgi:hypothetical protein